MGQASRPCDLKRVIVTPSLIVTSLLVGLCHTCTLYTNNNHISAIAATLILFVLLYSYGAVKTLVQSVYSRAGHYTVARRIRRINPSHSFPSVIVAIVSHGHGFQTV